MSPLMPNITLKMSCSATNYTNGQGCEWARLRMGDSQSRSFANSPIRVIRGKKCFLNEKIMVFYRYHHHDDVIQ